MCVTDGKYIADISCNNVNDSVKIQIYCCTVSTNNIKNKELY
jgi:hypothetical protein